MLSGNLLTRTEAESLTRVGGDDIYDLFYWANKIRIHFMGRDVKFCAIVAAKVGGCSEDCKFCAQSEHHDTRRQRRASKLTDEQLLDSAWHAAEVGADSFGIVNSGRGPTRRELEDWLKPIMMQDRHRGKNPRLRDAWRTHPRDREIPLRLRHPPDQPQHRNHPSGIIPTSSPPIRSASASTR